LCPGLGHDLVGVFGERRFVHIRVDVPRRSLKEEAERSTGERLLVTALENPAYRRKSASVALLPQFHFFAGRPAVVKWNEAVVVALPLPTRSEVRTIGGSMNLFFMMLGEARRRGSRTL
jgi:hypothetical protein